MKKSSEKTNWKISEPALSPTTWSIWDLKSFDPSNNSEIHGQLEEKLGWPKNSISLLELAFKRGLSRDTGWKTDSSPPKALATIAKYFKRGVAVGEFTPSQRSGFYNVEIDNTPPTYFSDEFLIVDAGVAASWDVFKNPFVIKLDEHTKTLDSVAAILDEWRARGCPTSWTIVGGGILGDTAGFASCLAKTEATFVPTTLLSMTDSSVGGKTGVNFPPFGKNQVGAFHFPKIVRIWPSWLKTLDARQIRAGGSECLKHGFISDVTLCDDLTKALRDIDLDSLASLLPKIVAVKSKVVTEDPGEQGRRAILNFGHTLAHALEAISQKNTDGNTTLLHGEAVAVGMSFAAHLSAKQCSLPKSALEKIDKSLQESGVLLSNERLTAALGNELSKLWPEILDLIHQDKKQTSGNKSEWVLLTELGKPAVKNGKYTVSLSDSEIETVWRNFDLCHPQRRRRVGDLI